MKNKNEGVIKMLCENCGKRVANVQYSENINGRKKELHLCQECSQKLGITTQNYAMPFDFGNLLGSFLEEFNTPIFSPLLQEVKDLTCDSCGYTFEDIVHTGRYGCPNCYETFEDRMDPILKKLQGSNRHTGRIGKVSDNHIKMNQKQDKKQELTKLEKLQEQLKQLVKEEKYEEAAQIRDEIKKIEQEK